MSRPFFLYTVALVLLAIITLSQQSIVNLKTSLQMKASSAHVENFVVNQEAHYSLNCYLGVGSLIDETETKDTQSYMDIFVLSTDEAQALMNDINYKPKNIFVHARLTSTSGKVTLDSKSLKLPTSIQQYSLFFENRRGVKDMSIGVDFRIDAQQTVNTRRPMRTFVIIFSVVVICLTVFSLLTLAAYSIWNKIRERNATEVQCAEKSSKSKFTLMSPSEFVDIEL